MTKAIVVFSDGSKRLAHNLDDSAFRWMERKAAQADEVRHEFGSGIVLPDVSNPETYDQAIAFKAQLVAAKTALEQRRLLLDGQYAYADEFRHVRLGIHEVDGLLHALAEPMRKFRIEMANDDQQVEIKREKAILRQRIDSLTAELMAAQKEIIRLQHLLISQFEIPDTIVFPNGFTDQ